MHADEIISGTIEKFLFQNSESGFTICIIQSNQTAITVKGYLPSIQIGQDVQIKGKWVFHKKFGKQFEAEECIQQLPTTIVGLKKYLGSGFIKGIGPKFADKLVNYFGTKILEIIDKFPERLKEIEGIGPKKVEKIKNAWHDQKEIAHIMVFLREKGISQAIAGRIYKQYKKESISILKQNPYKIAEDVWGIGFKTADEIALKIGFLPYSTERVVAATIHVITTVTLNGHLYIELEDLKEKTLKLLTLNEEEHGHILKSALSKLHQTNKIIHINQDEFHYLTLTSYYYSEKGVASKINSLLKVPSKIKVDIDKIYKKLRINFNKIELNEDQQRGILTSLKEKITIITGGPGTGKTTLIKTLLSVLEENNIQYKLAAPTGRAAKRITESTGKYAVTIHRLLEFNVSSMNFTYNEKNALKADFLIIDEASMIDIFLANAILKAVAHNAHIVFIGDIDQLPSVGPGNFLTDLISSNKISCIRLTHIFRQAQNSLITINAHRINKGEFPIYKQEDARRDFIFIKEEDPENLLIHLKKILFIGLKKYNINLNETMILTPMNRGIAGTHSLNFELQKLLNPETLQVQHTGTSFKINDKVMQIRNNYDKRVYNGDIGIIDSIDLEEKIITVNFEQNLVNYEFEELNELVLAYAISIHKSQGSEYDAVVVPLFMQHFMLLQKNLIYTALTRAKKLCIFIGQVKALAIALRNAKESNRLTFLRQFLIES